MKTLVIYEQHYDIVSILDIITEDNLYDFKKHFCDQVLKRENVLLIADTKDYNGSFSVKTKYKYKHPDGSERHEFEWTDGFDYVEFTQFNNYKNVT